MDEKKEKEKNSVCSHMPLIINFLKDDKFKTKSFLV